MKYILILLILAGLCSKTTHAQSEYTVVKIKGKIKIVPGYQLIKVGSRIKDSQSVAFENGAVALVVHPKKGEFVLRQKQNSSGSIGKAIQGMVSNYLQLSKKTVATRSFTWLPNKDIKKLFGPEPVPIKADTSFVINNEKYVMTSNTYFYISYIYRNETINKTLDYIGEKLIISPQKIFMVDGHAIDEAETSQMRLYFYRATTKTAEFICSPNFVFFQ